MGVEEVQGGVELLEMPWQRERERYIYIYTYVDELLNHATRRYQTTSRRSATHRRVDQLKLDKLPRFSKISIKKTFLACPFQSTKPHPQFPQSY